VTFGLTPMSMWEQKLNGAQGRDRTTDTAIFSHVHPNFLSP
jgi:hypothetical protein